MVELELKSIIIIKSPWVLTCEEEGGRPSYSEYRIHRPVLWNRQLHSVTYHSTSGPLGCCCLYFEGGALLFTATPRTRKEFLSRQSLSWLRGRTIGALRAERHTLTSAEWTSCSACHGLLCSRAFLFTVLRSAQHPQIPRFLQIFRGIWSMPLSLLNHSALALFAQRTRIPTSARSIGFCAIWVCISSSSSSISTYHSVELPEKAI